MQFRVNIKPMKYFKTSILAANMYAPVNSTKQEVKQQVFKNFVFTISKNFSGYLNRELEIVRVATFQKIRRKTVEVTDKRLLKKGIKRQVVRPTHWVATYYNIPIALLAMMNVKAVQELQTWKLVPLK